MNLAINCIENDIHAAWQAANSATRCNRMEAIITPADCERNRNYTYANSYCANCGGLDNQVFQPQQIPPALELVWDADREAATGHQSDSVDDQVKGFEHQDEIIGDFEIDLDDEELLRLFPEFADESAEPIEKAMQRFTEFQVPAPRRAVYHGTCDRCGGRVEDDRERNDDNVFRCLCCGWRTGEEYERNRQIQAQDGVMA